MAKAFDLSAFAYAHCGLWLEAGPVENSLAAFRAAAEAGLGVEFDVRPAADGTPVIYHDYSLERLTSRADPVESLTSAELSHVALPGGQKVPRLADLLDIWPEDLPLLTEMKIDGITDPAGFAKRVADELACYSGLAAIMSFSPLAVAALPADIMRGQLVFPSNSTSQAAFDYICAEVCAGSADYIAPHVSDAGKLRDRLPEPVPAVTWTVRTEADLKAARAADAAIIFEALDPALVTGAALP